MAGQHQINNASLAITAMLTLREQGQLPLQMILFVRVYNVRNGQVAFEQWPNQIVLDGAHNSEGTAALIQTLKTSIQETIITLFMRH